MAQSYFGLNKSNSWILNAAYIDLSRLRNKIANNLWSSLSDVGTANIGFEIRLVELFMNHRSLGLYNFYVKITPSFEGFTSETLLYEGIDNSDLTKFVSVESANPTAAIWGDWEQKIPLPNELINWKDFAPLARLIALAGNQEFKTEIPNQLNIENTIDYYLFVNLLLASDNLGKNWMFYKNNNLEKFKLFPWDLDGILGRNPFAEPTPTNRVIKNNLFHRLLLNDVDSCTQRVKDRWNELRGTIYSYSSLESLITDNFDTLIDMK